MTTARKRITPFNTMLTDTIKRYMQATDTSQDKLAKGVNRSQTYIGERCIQHMPWTTTDIDDIAKYFGLPNGFALVDEARGVVRCE